MSNTGIEALSREIANLKRVIATTRNLTDCEKAIMVGRTSLGGHSIIWKDEQWWYEDNMEPIPANGGVERPCIKCGELFGREEEDICLGMLPGVDNACCGHGDPSMAYIRFTNGIIVRGFTVEKNG